MLSRFLAISIIIIDITLSPNHEIGLRFNNMKNFEIYHFPVTDWLYLSALKFVSCSFYEITVLLSGSKYPTLSIAFHVLDGLKLFITS
ncbi:unnamed protein product [Adineta steineri]|uniref:Uncharacterized protein n=1 Tax=Adineta steineri TaxID=433720 RepID=A0A818MQV3_9BILA|nr:unnamed protein product [Adineta steineri]CAF0868957.1 unnamed protein product [Adineta steineri]CAF0876718.1 unnamed protein product [Adineta steineri]CAF3593141.1 unnamed protein product [Adineta steineri]CAF4042817.1 unnamed protein product [Adineta steineri]